MPRPKSQNTHQIAFKIPEAKVRMADQIAAAIAENGVPTGVTRTDVLRAALRLGLATMHTQHVSRRRTATRKKKSS